MIKRDITQILVSTYSSCVVLLMNWSNSKSTHALLNWVIFHKESERQLNNKDTRLENTWLNRQHSIWGILKISASASIIIRQFLWIGQLLFHLLLPLVPHKRLVLLQCMFFDVQCWRWHVWILFCINGDFINVMVILEARRLNSSKCSKVSCSW